MATQSPSTRKLQRFFAIVLILSVSIFAISSLRVIDPGGTGPVSPDLELNLVETLSLASSIGSLLGLIVTTLIGIRRERRASQNNRMKTRLHEIRMQRELIELEREKLELEKLKSGLQD